MNFSRTKIFIDCENPNEKLADFKIGHEKISETIFLNCT